MAKFFRFPFGISGDRVAVPDDAQPGGEVSYAQGFGPDYELELGVDPGAKPVPRDETNQIHFDVTDNIRQYQLNGVPDWHPASDNGGVSIPYPLNATVRHNDLVYRSIVATNIVEPGTDPTKWVVDGVAGQATTGVAGLTRYATDAEAVARTATDRAVTPANLGALYALLLNNPVFPEVLGTGLFTLTNPANNVRIAAGTQWVHRGVNTYTSVLTDRPTVANKTYHLRWDPVNGFALYDLSSGAYNPSSVAEASVTFDTTYDSMLIARVITNASNVATITPLLNKNNLSYSEKTGRITDLSFGDVPQYGIDAAYRLDNIFTYNWGRSPKIDSVNSIVGATAPAPFGSGVGGVANVVYNKSVDRYRTKFDIVTDFIGAGTSGIYAEIDLRVSG